MVKSNQEHCRRVSALAAEFARRANLPVRDQEIVADCALLHHYPRELLSTKTVAAVLRGIDRPGRPKLHESGAAIFGRQVQEVVNLLTTVHSASLNQRRVPLADLFGGAHYVVERLESLENDGCDHRDEVAEGLRRRTEEGLHSSLVSRVFESLPKPQKANLVQSASRLPVYPKIALKALSSVSSDDVSFASLEALIRQDQVMAGHLINVANSALFGAVKRISTIRHALSYIGLNESRRVITAACLRPLFASGRAATLWKHSILVARWCETLAPWSAQELEEEAFLAGLLHDIGRLMMSSLAGEASLTLVRLVEHGCDSWFAEKCIFGCDHGDLGGAMLEAWSFPENLIEAVKYHHRPENSPYLSASVVCLAESMCPGEESAPSAASLERVAERTGTALDSLKSIEPEVGLLARLALPA